MEFSFGRQEMSEQGDDTTERDAPSPTESERESGRYYYDDTTGYEIYDPSKDEDEDDDRQEEKEDAGADAEASRAHTAPLCGQSVESSQTLSSGKP
jgi:hypothetical protein